MAKEVSPWSENPIGAVGLWRCARCCSPRSSAFPTVVLIAVDLGQAYLHREALRASEDLLGRVEYERTCHGVPTWELAFQLGLVVVFALAMFWNTVRAWRGQRRGLEWSWLACCGGLTVVGLGLALSDRAHGYEFTSAGVAAFFCWAVLRGKRRLDAWRSIVDEG